MPGGAIGDRQRGGSIVRDVPITDTKSIEGQAAQVDAPVSHACVDRDGILARACLNAGDAHAVVGDADRLGDGHRAIVGRIEHVDLAGGGGLGERKSKSLAGCGARAGATVGSLSGNKRPVCRVGRRGGEAEGEQSPGDGWQRFDLCHGALQATRNGVAGAAYRRRSQGGNLDRLAKTLYRGRTVDPIKKLSTACAAWRPSRIAQTIRDWPRRMSPQAKTLGIEVL
jgi:hypothetical protein